MAQATEILKQHGLRITSMRQEILNVFVANNVALSSQDIEKELEYPDRITVYRTLKKFEEAGIIHHVYDSSSNLKYAMCINGCDAHQHQDSHLHFQCLKCDNTTCLNESPNLQINTPVGFTFNTVEVLVKGVCGQCNGFN